MTGPAPDALRRAERRRKLQDAARVLPMAGALLFFLPLLWRTEDGWSTAAVAVYLFGLWALLILVAALMASRLGARA